MTPSTASESTELPVSVHPPGDVPLRASVLLTHSGISVSRFIGMHMTAALLPLVAGLLLYGWRGLVSVLLVVGSAAAGTALWRRAGSRGRNLRYSHTLWFALLLAFTLPPHLLTNQHVVNGETVAPWPLLPAAGLLLSACVWLLGDVGSGRVHPVLVAHLLLAAGFHAVLTPQVVLQPGKLFVGDVLKAGPANEVISLAEPWIHTKPLPGRDALRMVPASGQLAIYTTGVQQPEREFLSLDSLLRDRMPALEDLIIGGHPGPIGASSAIAVIVGGLFLLYRGLIDYRIPLLIVLSAFAAMMLLPVPTMIHETSRDMHWVAWRQLNVGLATAVTFVNYELVASPLLFMSFFLATSPAVRPMSRRGRTIYAVLIGILCGVTQLYVSVALGPYLAMLIVSLITPTLDKWFRPRTLL